MIDIMLDTRLGSTPSSAAAPRETAETGLIRSTQSTANPPMPTTKPIVTYAIRPEVENTLKGYAKKLTGHQDRADDLLQDTMVKALEEKYLEEGKAMSWLMTVMRRTFICDYRKRTVRHETPFDIDLHDQTAHLQDEDQTDQTSQIYEVIKNEIDKLPSQQALSLKLVAVDGLSYEAAAKSLEKPVEAVKATIKRGRDKVRASLAKEYGERFPILLKGKRPSKLRRRDAPTVA